MSTSFVFISLIFAVLALVIIINKDNKPSLWGYIRDFVSLYFFFGFILLALSRPITIVNGPTKDECEQKNFLFFYNYTINSTSSVVFLVPFVDDVIINNTDEDIMVHPIICGEVDEKPSPKIIEKYSVAKVKDRPEYLFEPLPNFISYSTSSYSSSKGVVKWALIRPEDDDMYHGFYINM
ncbi:MAG: hypothetical protein IKW20_02790 [Bacteroidales bacterium]|nr:hypothetical protein [Bacteroidales bacterium]MBR5834088.1 hypothetical protein [Bacteroidales bacterium]